MAPFALESTRFAILASGRGSNAVALMDSFESGFIPATLALLFSNNPDAAVLEAAKSRGYATQAIASRGIPRQAHEEQLLACLQQHRIDHLLLAGYMRILSDFFLERFQGKILNIHPSLLPDFPGLRGAERQWEAGRKVVGATVHLVDAGVDTGPTLLQGSIVRNEGESCDTLVQRILTEVEHVIYPRAVRLFLERLEEAQAAGV